MKRLFILLCCVSLAGCLPHFKEVDSYGTEFRNTNTYPEGATTPAEQGDPYTFGGIAAGSGGLFARQTYATDNDSPDFRDQTASGKMGETGKERKQTPGGLPGVSGSLPGTAQGLPGFEDLPKNFPNTSIGSPGVQTSGQSNGSSGPVPSNPRNLPQGVVPNNAIVGGKPGAPKPKAAAKPGPTSH